MMFIPLFSSAVVVVGFRETLYTAEESAGSVGLEVVVISGTLKKDVNLLFSTANGTATGTIIICFLVLEPNCSYNYHVRWV